MTGVRPHRNKLLRRRKMANFSDSFKKALRKLAVKRASNAHPHHVFNIRASFRGRAIISAFQQNALRLYIHHENFSGAGFGDLHTVNEA